jgi:pimeloyl-ACP methyl ester carboxylesterase
VRNHRAGLTLLPALLVGLLAASCGLGGSTTATSTSDSTTPTAPTTTQAPTTSTTTANSHLAGFTPCAVQPFDQPWLCRTIDVPLDRASPAAGTIHLAVYALAHTDTATPAGPPLFTSPGGPGDKSWGDPGMWTLTQGSFVSAHHDLITLDPRGTGLSSAINCSDLQAHQDRAVTLDAACAASLNGAADRYGAGDRALDLEQVRQTLGYDTFDYYGASAASTDIQAYAHRFPEHLHAVVIDAGYTSTATPPDYADYLFTGQPRELIAMAVLACRRDAPCHARDREPARTLLDVIRRVQRGQIKGVSEVDVVRLLQGGDLPAIVEAAADARDGQLGPLRHLVAPSPPDPPQAYDSYSAGDNSAAYCNDQDAPWARADPLTVRRRKLAALLARLPGNGFAPFTRKAWTTTNPPDWCIGWPAPHRFVPVMPPGSPLIGVPALLLSGDLDRNALTSMSRAQMPLFSNARFLVVAGAGHPTMTGDTGTCVAGIVTRFIDTLDPGDTACAETPPG